MASLQQVKASHLRSVTLSQNPARAWLGAPSGRQLFSMSYMLRMSACRWTLQAKGPANNLRP
jgi:hypothetical protein